MTVNVKVSQWLVWPLPALATWLLAWAVQTLAQAAGAGLLGALMLASALGVAMSTLGSSWWRRLMIGLGFPLSWVFAGAHGDLPVTLWLAPLGLLLLIYPLNAWRDAPLFPTPLQALHALGQAAPLPALASVLDAGCGLGDGLRALRLAYPQASLAGVENSGLLRLLCAWRCPWAQVRQGDMWGHSWAAHQLVYLFQRPESMPRALAKAAAELKPGAWLVSLEFEAQGAQPTCVLHAPDGRPLWLYQAPLVAPRAGAPASAESAACVQNVTKSPQGDHNPPERGGDKWPTRQ